MLAKAQTGDIVFWSLVLMAGVAILGFGVWYLRRWLFSPIGGEGGDEWSLQHLRELRSAGELSEEEFQSLRAKMIAQIRSADARRAENARKPATGIEGEADSDQRDG